MEIIKFNPIQERKNLISKQEFLDIDKWRRKLFEIGHIGEYRKGKLKGVGYGNISIKSKNSFIISGNSTGGLEKLARKHYVRIINYNFDDNSVIYDGLIDPSSESMTHAAVYESNPNNNAVIHVHNLELFYRLLNKVPTTRRDVAYGTPEMAKEIIRLFNETDLYEQKILVMGGHKEGIVTFGKNLNQASKVLLAA